MTILKPAIVTAAALVLIAMASPAQASFDDQFICEPVSEGQYLVTMSSKDPSRANVQYQVDDGLSSDTEWTDTAMKLVYNYPESGARYAGGEYILLLTNSVAVLLYGIGTDNPGHTECKFAGEEPEEKAGEATADAAGGPIKMNVRAKSWGGKLRAGPGMDYDQTGSLREGERVTLIENTGVMMNGYSWFKIRRANGQEGYKWGGILCSDALHVIGLYQKCM